MNNQQLSQRLETVAGFIPEGSRLADIGSDHAYLPCVLANRKVITFAIAGEVVKGPFESAKEQIIASELEGTVQARLGDGLAVIAPADNITVVTICGMGGDLISKILDSGNKEQKLNTAKRLVLQPNNGERKLRIWLLSHGYTIIDETILEENEKIYEVIVAEKADETEAYSELEYTFGRYLLKEKNDAFRKKWLSEKDKYQYILNSLQKANKDLHEKEKQIMNKIKEISEVLG
ncbi:s-adenosyl-l-methionine-dependent methyltransferase [Trichococcus palustris]|uniref:S-adenosyl-l-methionine-dependent methyltransferase n=1 Tax=Trichococcus palustris TaxID=140314 RepID=A0A143YBM1_9LACT|nr:tRNA (adenine(22)-N(1))-methyltransferase TrmK [Trichococcus palustris]CZQ84848.1 s-adenosyl-l-methionine-dependent methyltransferase [Trichococcus palustris]SFK54151.1 tRNA (adenine22-N1)-methyltransferase [Trichococcus palustris]